MVAFLIYVVCVDCCFLRDCGIVTLVLFWVDLPFALVALFGSFFCLFYVVCLVGYCFQLILIIDGFSVCFDCY